MPDWVITGTRNTRGYLESGVEILQNGGSALDAVESVIRGVELNPNDFSVGFNGFPNLLGEVELDASIMVGSSRKAGAVAGILHYLHPISIARKVMEETPHVLLVGLNAERFAKSIGFTPTDKMCEVKIKQFYNNIIRGAEILNGIEIPKEITDLAWRYDKYISEQLKSFDYRSWYEKLNVDHHGTVNVIAMDKSGEIVSGVSTSGLALKFPGRAGDSPIIGAGNYADLRFGAATCVGNGELAIRLSLARQVVTFLKQGLTIENATKAGIEELKELNENGVIQILAIDSKGNISAASNQELHYLVASGNNPIIQRKESQFI